MMTIIMTLIVLALIITDNLVLMTTVLHLFLFAFIFLTCSKGHLSPVYEIACGYLCSFGFLGDSFIIAYGTHGALTYMNKFHDFPN